MAKITLGRTGITVEQNAFGALPIQRIDTDSAVKLLQKAYRGGMRFFDTSRAYSDSEEKLGRAFGGTGCRDGIFLATKTMAHTPEQFRLDLEASLAALQTDTIDIYQFHLASVCYRPGDGTGMYECMEQARAQGKIRHIGLTTHSLRVAQETVASGLYETLQFPFSYLADEPELALVRQCRDANMGFIAMKALAGGLITNAAAAYAYITQFDHVLPIWGIQRERELDEFLTFMEHPAVLNEELRDVIARDRKELTGEFCRGCGYCMPCPAGIVIHQCARMSLMLRRAPSEGFLSPQWQEEMKKIENCLHCGKCSGKCPYHLDTPALLRRNYEDYQRILRGEVSVT